MTRASSVWLSFGLAMASSPGCSSGASSDAGAYDGASGLDPGASCRDAGECGSQVCLGGRCCAEPCNIDPQHPECSSCDVGGNCQYPPALCRAASCDPDAGSAASAALCRNGSCPAPAVAACAAGCRGDACGDGCSQDQDCAPGFRCYIAAAAIADAGGGLATLLGTCAPRGAPGAPCAHADECRNGLCLGGFCCAAPCSVDLAHPECASCDATGACDYPAEQCVAPSCDSASNTLVAAVTCRAGICPLDGGARQSCGAYACSPTAGCRSSCLSDQECLSSAYCAPLGGAGQCCDILTEGAAVSVDILYGSDQGCCGSAAAPCQTVTHVQELFTLAKARAQGTPLRHLNVEMTVGGGDGGDWYGIGNPVNEPVDPFSGVHFPPLADGVSLHAPGIFLDAVVTSPDPNASTALRGDPGRPVYLGIDANGQQQNAGSSPLGLTLQGGTFGLANASVWGPLSVQAGTLVLGADQSGAYAGPVEIGGPRRAGWLLQPKVAGSYGFNAGPIYQAGGGGGVFLTNPFDSNPGFCGFNNADIYTTIRDVGPPDSGEPTLIVHNLAPGVSALDIGGCTAVDLTHNPQFGDPRQPDGGFSGDYGVVFSNPGQFHLANATIQGWAAAGVASDDALAPDGGTSALIENSVIRENGCYGVLLAGSNVALRHDAITQNYQNISYQPSTPLGGASVGPTTGYLDLSAGNVVACSSSAWLGPLGDYPNGSILCPPLAAREPAVDLWNTDSVGAVNASHVSWSSPSPALWTCNQGLDPSSCVADAGGQALAYDGGPLQAVNSPDPTTGLTGSLNLSSPSPNVTCP